MQNSLPFVSVIVPCRNEEKYIGKCLESIIGQDYPKEKTEIIVIDGMSKDKTREIIQKFTTKYPNIKLFDNSKKIQSRGFNIGIKEAQGNILIILGAHTIIAPDFISRNIEYLEKTNADCVGGPIKSINNSFVGRAVSLVISSPFGVGGAKFRYSQKERYVDTVAYGAYRREVFDKIGLFDERLVRNQDIEFNNRLRKADGRIFMTPQIKSYYQAPETLAKLWRQNFRNGLWNIYTQKLVPGSLRIRHFVPLCFVGGLLGSSILTFFTSVGKMLFVLMAGSYILANLFFSIKISFKKGLKYLVVLPITFFTLHFSYGLGSIWGLLTLWKIKK
jgi:cellulose synthase/poly-beta-1,6-N-acetylglucosamine synthase-like glycosyltransferase